MEAKQIKVVKKWLEPKSVQVIQVFLGFANFYQQFIQGFSKIAASLTSMIKMTGSLDVSRLEVGNSNDEVIEFRVGSSSKKLTKKSGKSKSQNLAKSQKSCKVVNL